MSEKTKNAIIEVLKSADMRAYLEELLYNQTKEIVTVVHSINEAKQSEVLSKATESLSKERVKNSDLEQQVSKLEMARVHCKDLLDEKTKAYDEAVQKISELENQISDISSTVEQLKGNYNKTTRRLEEQLDKEKDEKKFLLEKKAEYDKRYFKIDLAYSIYQSLSESVKQRVSNIFGNGNIYSFIAAASDWNSVEGIWSFTKRRIIEDDGNELDEIVKLFNFIFEVYCMFDENSRYELICPNVGERFNSDKQSIKGIKTDGQIEEVLLNGVYDKSVKKTVFKAIVKVQ